MSTSIPPGSPGLASSSHQRYTTGTQKPAASSETEKILQAIAELRGDMNAAFLEVHQSLKALSETTDASMSAMEQRLNVRMDGIGRAVRAIGGGERG